MFKGILTLSATARNEKITFLPIFEFYSNKVCLCSIHVDFFFSLFQCCSYDFQNSNLFKAVFLWAQWGPKKEFDGKNQSKNLASLSPLLPPSSFPLSLTLPLSLLFPSPLPSSSLSSSPLSPPFFPYISSPMSLSL